MDRTDGPALWMLVPIGEALRDPCEPQRVTGTYLPEARFDSLVTVPEERDPCGTNAPSRFHTASSRRRGVSAASKSAIAWFRSTARVWQADVGACDRIRTSDG
jgi:hypothetical protein